MIFYKTDEEVEIIRENCILVCKTLALVGSMLKPGITGAVLDAAAEEFIRDHGAEPGFKGYGGFPATLCVSPNEQVVHGIPNSQQVFKEGDIVSVDCGTFKNDFFGDAAFTFAIGDVEETTMELLRATNTSLYLGIEKAIAGNRLGDVSYAIQHYVQVEHKYSVVRELVGHGLGRNLHEEPEVPNYGKRGKGIKLQDGLVIAIEPMVNLGTKRVVGSSDGWTVSTKDKQPSAHYEHTLVVREGKADILSDHSFVLEAIAKNDDLQTIGLNMDVAV